jgi:hypothetical protein
MEASIYAYLLLGKQAHRIKGRLATDEYGLRLFVPLSGTFPYRR